MIVDLNFNSEEQTAYMTFFPKEFEEDQDFHLALLYLQMISADFDIDPELEVSNLQEIISQARSEGEDCVVVFDINEDGIEAEIVNPENE